MNVVKSILAKAEKFHSPLRVVLLLIFLAFCQPVFAQVTPEVERQATGIFDSVMSPFCPGRTLSGCPSGDAIALRKEILLWLSQGQTRDEIVMILENRYGKAIYGAPKAEGFGLAAWIIPMGFVLLGTLVIAVFFSRKNKLETEEFEPSEELLERVEEELKQRMEN